MPAGRRSRNEESERFGVDHAPVPDEATIRAAGALMTSGITRSTVGLLQLFLLLMCKVACDELEMRRFLEGFDDSVGRQRAEQQEKTVCALSHLG
jgi:hypothetical protein